MKDRAIIVLADKLAKCKRASCLQKLKQEYIDLGLFSRELFNKAAKLLSPQERENLKAFTAIQKTIDATNTPNSQVNWADIICAIDFYMRSMSWSVEDGKTYLQKTYNKHSRHQLTDLELWEFHDYLKTQFESSPIKKTSE